MPSWALQTLDDWTKEMAEDREAKLAKAKQGAQSTPSPSRWGFGRR